MSSSPTNRKPRVCTREACEPCRKGRSKCDGQAPCSRCASRGLECEYQARIHRSKRSLRDEIDELKKRQLEQDALLEALQDPLRRDVAMRMLQEKSRVPAANNTDGTGQQNIPIKQEERRLSGVGGWGSVEEVRATSGSPLQNFTSAPATHPPVSASPQISWTAPMRPDSVATTTGFESGPFPMSSVAPGFPGHLGSFVQVSNATDSSRLQPQIPLAEFPDVEAHPLPYRPQHNDWTRAATDPTAERTWMGPPPEITGNLPLHSGNAGPFSHGGTIFQTSWESPQGPPYSGPNINASAHNMAWTQGPDFPSGTISSTSSFPPKPTSTRPISPASLRTHSGSTTSSSATNRSAATSMTSVAPSTTSMHVSPFMKHQTAPFNETTNEPEHQQNTTREFPPDEALMEDVDPRERHRLASARSWSKQKGAIAELQATVSRVEAQHTALRQEYAQVLNQVQDVHQALLKHVGCNDPAISMWLKRDQEMAAVPGRRESEPSRPTNVFQGDTTMMAPDGKAHGA